jgi:hypothetical protein
MSEPGKRRRRVLYSRTDSLNLRRSTVIRFSVPSSWLCRARKFWFDLSSG